MGPTSSWPQSGMPRFEEFPFHDLGIGYRSPMCTGAFDCTPAVRRHATMVHVSCTAAADELLRQHRKSVVCFAILVGDRS